MKTCCADKASMKGLTTALVAKQKIKPNVMDMGSAGKAFRQIAKSKSVRQSPINIATKHAIVVVQSP